jgi:hypothetical protein
MLEGHSYVGTKERVMFVTNRRGRQGQPRQSLRGPELFPLARQAGL